MSENIWAIVLGEIELTVSRANFVTWFKNTSIIQQSDELLIIGVPNIFIKQQLEKKFNSLILNILKKNNYYPAKIEYKVVASNKKGNSEENLDSILTNQQPTTDKNIDTPVIQKINPNISMSYRQSINSKYTFDNFVVGSTNELAFAACQSIANNPGKKYNPLLIYGGVGIGKTHLIQAVGNEILKNNPKAKVLYITTEQFVQEFVEALRSRKTIDFANHYRTADVFIVDDIQFIAGKEKIQEEFFHTFNSLHQANKQIILSSDHLPKDIPTLEERLQSRFAWGMSIDMQNPEFETRCAILQIKAQANNINLPADVVDYLATHIQTNVRELEGALNQVLAYCEMRFIEPDLEVAKKVISNTNSRPKHISAKQIVDKTARHFQITTEEILGPKRDKDIVVPRQVAMYFLRSELHLSFPKIARELKRKDHTTAIHSVEKIEHEIQFDNSLKQAISDIKERLYA